MFVKIWGPWKQHESFLHLYSDQGEITDRERTIFVAYQYAASAVIINTISTQAPLLPIIKLAVGPVIVYLWIFKVLGANIMRLVVKKEAEGGAV